MCRLRLIGEYKKTLEKDRLQVNKNFFVYSSDPAISAFAVSLLNFPYEVSEHWKREFSNATGYQEKLFEKDYEDFMKTVDINNEKELMTYLKMDEDKTHIEVESALGYLKLRKIRRMLMENQIDLEKSRSQEEYKMLKMTEEHLAKMESEVIDIIKAHEHLKDSEREITNKMGTTIIK